MLIAPLCGAALLAFAPPVKPLDGGRGAFAVPAIARPHTAFVEIDRAAVEELARAGGGVLKLPLGNTRVAPLELRPTDSFHAGSRVEAVGVDAKGQATVSPVEVRGAFLSGGIAGEPGTHAFLAVSDAGTFGYVETPTNTYIISSGPFGAGLPTVSYDLTSMPPGVIETPAWTCATPELEVAAEHSGGEGGIAGVQPCRQVRVAFETDYEFLQRFSGSTTAATGYIATLASALTSIYTRDVNVRVASTYARLWTTAADPWSATSTSAQLDEFSGYWSVNMGWLQRDLAHFLSGRNLGGGVAYLPGLCGGAPWGVSANLAGFFPTPLVDNNGQNWDIIVVAHELGHNFGAPHTHNYNPPVDGCGSSPQDCTVANQDAGTIMSYCHLCPGGVQNVKLQFHPANIASIEAHLGSVNCQYTGPATAPIGIVDRPAVAATVPTLLDVLANEIEFNCEAVVLELASSTTANGAQISVSQGSGPDGRDQILYRMPNAAFSGTDGFYYTLRDTSGSTSTTGVVATVSSVRIPENPMQTLPGLDASYYILSAPTALPDFSALSPYLNTTAAALNFASSNGAFAASGRTDNVGAVFSGWIDVPVGGVWTFYTNSNEGSRLRIGSAVVVNNDGIHAMTEVGGTIGLAAGKHAFTVEFFERTGAAGLIVSWQGPGIAKEVIPASAFRRGGVDSPADIDNNGAVDGADLAIVLGAWGTSDAAADITRDGVVDGADLSVVLNSWSQ